jgi:hypothetical protein
MTVISELASGKCEDSVWLGSQQMLTSTDSAEIPCQFPARTLMFANIGLEVI